MLPSVWLIIFTVGVSAVSFVGAAWVFSPLIWRSEPVLNLSAGGREKVWVVFSGL